METLSDQVRDALYGSVFGDVVSVNDNVVTVRADEGAPPQLWRVASFSARGIVVAPLEMRPAGVLGTWQVKGEVIKDRCNATFIAKGVIRVANRTLVEVTAPLTRVYETVLRPAPAPRKRKEASPADPAAPAGANPEAAPAAPAAEAAPAPKKKAPAMKKKKGASANAAAAAAPPTAEELFGGDSAK